LRVENDIRPETQRYPSELKSTAEPIAFSLRSRGHNVFLDRDDLPPGESYDDQIENAATSSDCMIFLITPRSVERGRYTLTELAHARRRWRKPARRVLPVMVEPTPLETIPSFLKGVTILEPAGNLTAEVSAAAHARAVPKRSVAAQTVQAGALAVAGFFGIALLLGLLFHKSVESGFAQEPALNIFLLVAALSLPMSMVLMTFGGQHPWRSLTALLTQIPGMLIITQDSNIWLQALGVAETSPLSAKTAFAFGTGAAIAALLTIAILAAASFASPSFRSVGRWLMTIMATILICGAAMLPFGEQLAVANASETQTWISGILIIVWLAVCGSFLGFWLARGDPATDEEDRLSSAPSGNRPADMTIHRACWCHTRRT
jgi:hypothetical protein